MTFADRYDGVTPVQPLVNRRSRPAIVELANAFAQTIPERLDKEMGPFREAGGPAVSIAVGLDDEETEADAIADRHRARCTRRACRYRDIAILVRGTVAYPRSSSTRSRPTSIPVQPGGRTGLFEQPEAAVFGATFAWLADIDWAPGRFIQRETIDARRPPRRLPRDCSASTTTTVRRAARRTSLAWQAKTTQEPPDCDVSLVGELLRRCSSCSASRQWDLTDALQRNRLGTVARFTTCSPTTSRSPGARGATPTNPGEQVGGAVGDEWFYRNFALLLVNYATGNYDDFDGEEDLLGDGVALGTVHGAKGLEWPVVFLPSLTDGRFPSSRTGPAAGLAGSARPVRRRPVRGVGRRRAPAVLRRAHPRARLGVAVVAPDA